MLDLDYKSLSMLLGYPSLIAILAIWSLWISPVFAADSDWDRILDQGSASRVFFGVAISGPQPYLRNADAAFEPASTAKLFTAGAALETLGAGFRFETIITYREYKNSDPSTITDLALTGSGDPSWTLPHGIVPLAQALHARGVRQILGAIRLQASDPRWIPTRFPPGWDDEDRISCYAAIAQAFNLNQNCATLIVEATNRASWQGGAPIAPIQLDIKTGASTSLRIQPWGENGYQVSGVLKRGGPSPRFPLPVRDTRPWVLAQFQAALIKQGIRLDPHDSPPQDSRNPLKEIRIHSESLNRLLRPMLKESQNLIADAIFKALGSKTDSRSKDLLEAGRQALATYTNDSRIALEDGSGISRASRLTAQSLQDFLLNLRAQPYFQEIWEALPIAGVDGTLSSRMRATSAESVLRAKTGSLTGIYHLAGFVPEYRSAGEAPLFHPFVILARSSSSLRGTARATQDRLGAELAEKVLRFSSPIHAPKIP